MGKTDFQISELHPNNTPLSLLKSCASLYCDIWREPPWNETFWTVPEVLQDMNSELRKNQAKGFIALTTNYSSSLEPIGLTWGYGVSLEEMRLISGTAQLDHFFKGDSRVFYIDELGVKADMRIKGVGLELSRSLIQWAITRGFTTMLLRTDLKATSARVLYSKLGFKELDIIDANEHQRNYWVLQGK